MIKSCVLENLLLGCMKDEGETGIGQQIFSNNAGPYNFGCWYVGPQFFRCQGNVINFFLNLF